MLCMLLLDISDMTPVLYIEYLSMARAGLLALEHWDPKSKVCFSIYISHIYQPNLLNYRNGVKHICELASRS